jgi:HlyD family secretion protein
MHLSRLALGAAAVAVPFALGAFLPLARSGESDVPVLRIVPQDFVRRVPAQGNLRAVRATPINAPVGVRGPFRIGWLAPDGSLVKAGDVVIRFDPSDIEQRLIDAEDDLREARLKLEKEQVEDLAEVRKLEGDAALARIELENARRFQKKDAVIFSRHDIIESEIDQQLAQQRESHAQATRRTRQRLSGTETALLGIKIRQAGVKIQQAREALRALSVTAPHDGVLILKRDWRGEPIRVGDSVWNSQPLAEIPDLSAMQAEVYVLEADAGGLKAGLPASMTVESAPGVSYPARIARVDSLAKPRIPGSPVQYFAVTLELARTDPRVMKPGQRVQATLQLDRRRGALLVPRQALFDREGRSLVYRRSRRGFEPVVVALGPATMGRVVVESGLRAGDVLALRDPTRPASEPEVKPAAPPPAAPATRSGASRRVIVFR